MKIIKCYCNDELMCPMNQYRDQQIETGSSNIIRHCLTNTVCLTKRLKRLNGSTWLKYFCDHSSLNSLRGRVIQYRDCKVNATSNLDEKYIVEKSHEYCCDSHDYCNKDLTPTNYVRDIEEIERIHDSNEIDNSMHRNFYFNGHNPYLHMGMFTTINLILITSLLVFLIFTILLILAYTIKYYKHVLRFKGKIDHKTSFQEYSYNLHQPNYLSSIAPSTTSSNSTTDTNLKTTENSFNSYDWSSNLSSEMSKQTFKTQTSVLHDKLKNLNYPQINYSYSRTSSPSIATKSEKSSFSSCVLTSSSSSTTGSPIDKEDFKNKTYFPLEFSYPITNKPNTSETQTNEILSDTNVYEWSGSGSGAGVPELLQRTIARQIKLIYPCIGKGRFGEVYKGMWRDELVAVKTFNSADEKSWQNECAIYNTTGFRHENILGFIASDNIDRGTYTELWLITEYHKNGSLFDYLNLYSISINELFKMTISIANGLDHLHTSIESCTGKPALAHCDLKSKNILVKSDLTCCIGDLGLALRGDKTGSVIFNQTNNMTTIGNSSTTNQSNEFDTLQMNIKNNSRLVIRTGTKRYMAPEIISKTINIQSLVEFQYAEMYSLALIFWELLRRTKFEFNNQTYSYEYKMPYYEYIEIQDPDLEQMNHVVCINKKRPELLEIWRINSILNEFTLIIEELWNENAHARLNTLRLKKSLNSLYKKYSTH